MRNQRKIEEPYTHVVAFTCGVTQRLAYLASANGFHTSERLMDAFRFSESAARLAAEKVALSLVLRYTEELERTKQLGSKLIRGSVLALMLALSMATACGDGGPTAPAPRIKTIPVAIPPRIDTTAIQVQP